MEYIDFISFISLGLNVRLLERLFKFCKDNKALREDHEQFCKDLKPTSNHHNPHKILTYKGRAVWLNHVDTCLKLLSSLRNMLEHGFAGFNATTKMQAASSAREDYSRWQLLEELCEASKRFLEAIGFGEASFSMHSDYQAFRSSCKSAQSLSALFSSAAASPKVIRFTVPTSSYDCGSRMLQLPPSFYGREVEMQTLQRHLSQERCRVVILGGPGYGAQSVFKLSVSYIFQSTIIRFYRFIFILHAFLRYVL